MIPNTVLGPLGEVLNEDGTGLHLQILNDLNSIFYSNFNKDVTSLKHMLFICTDVIDDLMILKLRVLLWRAFAKTYGRKNTF